MGKDNSLKCNLCGVVYTHRQSLRRHLKTLHAAEIPIVKRPADCFKCSICTDSNTEFMYFKKRSDLLLHLKHSHEIEVTTEIQTFDSFEQFKLWKHKYEADHATKFRLMCGSDNLDNNGSSSNTIYYSCHRSGYFKSRGKGVRRLKTQGSRKIDGYCPSQIKVKITGDGSCTVSFTPTHVGHQDELAHVTLTPSERLSLGRMIAEKIPFNSILAEVKGSATTTNPGDLERIHLITKKDLHNIRASFDLESDKLRNTIATDIPLRHDWQNVTKQTYLKEKKDKEQLLKAKKEKLLSHIEDIKKRVMNSITLESLEVLEKFVIPQQYEMRVVQTNASCLIPVKPVELSEVRILNSQGVYVRPETTKIRKPERRILPKVSEDVQHENVINEGKTTIEG